MDKTKAIVLFIIVTMSVWGVYKNGLNYPHCSYHPLIN